MLNLGLSQFASIYLRGADTVAGEEAQVTLSDHQYSTAWRTCNWDLIPSTNGTKASIPFNQAAYSALKGSPIHHHLDFDFFLLMGFRSIQCSMRGIWTTSRECVATPWSH